VLSRCILCPESYCAKYKEGLMGPILSWLVAVSDFFEHHLGAITAIIAAAAVVQWRETRKTAERQLRAYVINSSAALFDGSSMMPAPFIDRTDQPGVILEINNFGQTPAYEVVHWAELQVAPIGQEWAMKPPPSLGNPTHSVVGPGHTLTNSRWLNRALSVQEKEGIINGTYAIYAYGRIEYVDAFKRRRWSNYKLRYTNSAWPPVGSSASMNFCAEGNEAD
jgi:hypothetical protein